MNADQRQALRSAFGRFATGVTIVTCLDAEGRSVGLTANSFSALSLDPPMALWSLRLNSVSLAAFAASEYFAVNVLSEAQVDLSRRFASSVSDKFAQGGWSPGLGQAPVLAGAAAVFECALKQQQDVGDHRLFIGEVHRHSESSISPLLFRGGHYHLLGEVM